MPSSLSFLRNILELFSKVIAQKVLDWHEKDVHALVNDEDKHGLKEKYLLAYVMTSNELIVVVLEQL